MNKRQNALEWIRICAAQGNMAGATRVYAENRISYKAFQEAVALGRRQAESFDPVTGKLKSAQ